MSLSGRRWTARQHLDHAEDKIAKHEAQGGLCANCTRYHPTPETMDWAHRIPDTKPNRKRFGREVIDHQLNGALVCKEMRAGRDCNAGVIVHDANAVALAQRIRKAIAAKGGT